MIKRIRGILAEADENKLCIDIAGICYEVNTSKTVCRKLSEKLGKEVELTIYHYLRIEKNKSIPIMIGFMEELERDFFEKFISISGIGPRAALRAFDKPVSSIAKAIEEGDLNFLNSLKGIGKQKAKQVVAQLQGKVGRFALIKTEKGKTSLQNADSFKDEEITQQAKQILKRLQYNPKEIDSLIKKAFERKPDMMATVEDLLNEIYYERR